MADSFDVVIVGAGIAGSALAAALSANSDAAGLRIALVEAQPLTQDWPLAGDDVDGFDRRVSAITAASQQWLAALGVWQGIADQRVSPYQWMHVWDADGTGAIDFAASEVNQETLGYIVENRIITTALSRLLRQQRRVAIYSPAQLQTVEALAGAVDLQRHRLLLDNGDVLETGLVIGADGANSWLRSEFGFATRQWAYSQKAIVATVKTAQPNAATAWQRFLPTGPLAFLPLRNAEGDRHLSSIVWSADIEQADALMALDDAAFQRELTACFEARLGAVEAISARACFPLHQQHAVNYAAPGIALVGDAAHTIHPLAGQGINLGLKDVRVLSEELLAAHARGLAAGHRSTLNRYERRRKADNLLMMGAVEGFKRLFGARALPVRWVRNTGMRWLDRQRLLKREIIRTAMGIPRH